MNPTRSRMVELGPPALEASSVRAEAGRLLAGAYLASTVTFGFVLFSPETRHWFVVPVTLCGMLMIADVIDWVRGRIDLFDPAGIIGVLGVHQFLLAPLLHVHLDYWMYEVVGPRDWRPWLGAMAVLNAIGLVAYRLARSRAFRPARRRSSRRVVWALDRRRFHLVVALVVVLSIVAQIAVYRSFGGIAGYIRAYTEDPESFRGMGWILLFSESFPILGFIAAAEILRRRRTSPSWLTIAVLLAAYAVVQFAAGGLRGSRSNTVFGLFWAAAITHTVLRPLPRKAVMVALVVLVGFLYGYGLYKGAGTDVLGVFSGETTAREIAEETGRTLETVILGDLARSDVQAFLLYRLTEGERGLGRAYGRTYLGALALVIPRSVWPDRPPTKVKEGTEALYGRGSYRGTTAATRVYGIAGEAMLNFGPLAVPFAFAVLGFAIGRLRRFVSELPTEDARTFLVPMAVLIAILALGADSDNLLVTWLKNVLVPMTVILLGGTWRARARST